MRGCGDRCMFHSDRESNARLLMELGFIFSCTVHLNYNNIFMYSHIIGLGQRAVNDWLERGEKFKSDKTNIKKKKYMCYETCHYKFDNYVIFFPSCVNEAFIIEKQKSTL